MFGLPTQTEIINNSIKDGAASAMDDIRFIEEEIKRWKSSNGHIEQINGERYYAGDHDILYNKRTAIGKDGKLEDIGNLPNKHDIDNQYAVAVDKKTNYFLGKPMAIETENEKYGSFLQEIMNRKFMRKMKNLCRHSLNGGIGWLYPSVDKGGNIVFSVFPAYEVLPEWADKEHEILDFLIRCYPVVEYRGIEPYITEYVEVYRPDGIYRYVFDNTHRLIPDVLHGEYSPYLIVGNKAYQWDKVPLIGFKYNEGEVPLIRRTKGLQDAINEMLSMFHNNMLEDSRNTLLIIKNYDGQDLGEFRHNLATYGAVKVRCADGKNGGVDTLQIEVNAENYEKILELLKMALIENARSFDGKMLKSGQPNQMNILSVYNEIDIDTNEIETEYQAAMEELLYFIDTYLQLTGKGDFRTEKVSFIFNRDMLINESEILNTLKDLGVKISQKTLLKQVPWIDDVDAELDAVKKEQQEAMEIYGDAFTKPVEDDNE